MMTDLDKYITDMKRTLKENRKIITDSTKELNAFDKSKKEATQDFEKINDILGQSQRDVHELVEMYQSTIHELSQTMTECLESKNYQIKVMTERFYKTDAQ